MGNLHLYGAHSGARFYMCKAAWCTTAPRSQTIRPIQYFICFALDKVKMGKWLAPYFVGQSYSQQMCQLGCLTSRGFHLKGYTMAGMTRLLANSEVPSIRTEYSCRSTQFVYSSPPSSRSNNNNNKLSLIYPMLL